MKACIVPPNPGNLSAFGLLAVDWRTDQIVTKVFHQDAIDLPTLASLYAGLEREASEALQRDGIEPERIRLVREADVRYVGQSMEVRVPAQAGPVDQRFLKNLIDAFHAAHLRTFGYNYAGEQKVEIVNLCVSGFGLIERPQLPKLRTAPGVEPQPPGIRPVYFSGAFRETPIYDRARCRPASSSRGRPSSRSSVDDCGFPGQQLVVDPHGVLIIRRKSPANPEAR